MESLFTASEAFPGRVMGGSLNLQFVWDFKAKMATMAYIARQLWTSSASVVYKAERYQLSAQLVLITFRVEIHYIGIF